MLLNEAIQECGLSKKALQYYEDKELIQPERLENGYRDYDAECIRRLKEIAVLKTLDLEVSDIKVILAKDYHDDIYSRAMHQIDYKTNLLQEQKRQIIALRKNQSGVEEMQKLNDQITYPYFYTNKLHLLYGSMNIFSLLLAVMMTYALSIPPMPALILPFALFVLVELYMEDSLLHKTRPYADNVAFTSKHLLLLFLLSLLRNLLLVVMLLSSIAMGHQLFQLLGGLWGIYSVFLCFRPIWNKAGHSSQD